MNYNVMIYKYTEKDFEREHFGSEICVGTVKNLNEFQKNELCAIVTVLGQTYHIEKIEEIVGV